MPNKKLSLFILPFVATFLVHANDPKNDPFFKDPFGDNIFKEMMHMQQNMDKMFERMHQRIQQRTIRQIAPIATYTIQKQSQFVDKGEKYEFVTNIPESQENQVDTHSENGRMSLTAKVIKKEEHQTANGHSTSSSMRMYQQKIVLPQNADESTLSMFYRDGYLIISIEKKKGSNIEKSIPVETQENNTSKKNIHKKNIQLCDDASMS